MIEILDLGKADAEAISDIAMRTWPDTYGKILSADQLSYMLDRFCTPDAIVKNIENGQYFIGLTEDGKLLGFAAYEFKTPDSAHLNKLYVLPDAQGKKAGQRLIAEVEQRIKSEGAIQLTLNVNRFNNARLFYEKQGFSIVKEIDIEIGQGYLMEDFVMRKSI